MKNLKPTLLCGMMLPAALSAQERPNILYIMTDQQTANAMSCAGNTDLRTPNMDKLAERGIRFTNAYCSMPLSGPSRGAMFTGYMPGEVGLLENGTPMPDSLHSTSLGVLMNKAGYTCAYAGKWHVHTNSLPDKQAFGFENLHGHNDFGRIVSSSARILAHTPSIQLRQSTQYLRICPQTEHSVCYHQRTGLGGLSGTAV